MLDSSHVFSQEASAFTMVITRTVMLSGQNAYYVFGLRKALPKIIPLYMPEP